MDSGMGAGASGSRPARKKRRRIIMNKCTMKKSTYVLVSQGMRLGEAVMPRSYLASRWERMSRRRWYLAKTRVGGSIGSIHSRVRFHPPG